jgi:hypothetical protein
VAIVGLWAGAVYEPRNHDPGEKGWHVVSTSLKDSIYRNGYSLSRNNFRLPGGPGLAERLGRKKTLAVYFAGMLACISLSFGWAFYLENGLRPFIAYLFFWVFWRQFCAVQFVASRAIRDVGSRNAFAFATSFGRFIGTGVNF